MTQFNTPDWTEQWDDCAPCEMCGSLVKQETLDASGWQPIGTMPPDLWVYVFVPGAGMGFEAIKRGGVITRLQSPARIIHRATHWRKVWTPPTGDLSGNYDYLAVV